jgi:very-short-patch-repair endonuclease
MRTKAWQRLAPGVYLPRGIAVTPELKIQAASRRLPESAVFSGLTAAWLHGLDAEPCDPIEITVPAPATVSRRSGMKLSRRTLRRGDTAIARGYRVTSIVRTLRDLCAGLSITEAVVLLDAALHRRLVAIDRLSLERSLARYLDHVEPKAESPMETRMRMRLVLAGLPRPPAQVPIYDDRHRIVGRPDLYYPEQRLGLEYDGGTHRLTLARDNRRQNALLNAGVRLLRFTAGDILGSPDAVVATVRRELGIIPRVR